MADQAPDEHAPLTPTSEMARFLVQARELWGSIVLMGKLYSSSDSTQEKRTHSRHALVDFCSLDDIFRELNGLLEANPSPMLTAVKQTTIRDAFRTYNRSVEPVRSRARTARNMLGAHRSLAPSPKEETKTGIAADDPWGCWEEYLEGLHRECDLVRWEPTLKEAESLLRVLNDAGLDTWFEALDDERFRIYTPISFDDAE